MTLIREPESRKSHEIRPLTFETHVNRYAEGSVIVKAGNTHVLCTASVEETVPSWMAGKGKGWITAEYSMLPRATHTRNRRERDKVSGRTQEIQRLIGRALRVMLDLNKLGERSILVDCDVIQADGGTRTASITGACIAVSIALGKLIRSGKVPATAWNGTIAAISVGMKQGQVLVDLDYNEDSTCDVDMNFVMTSKNEFVEVQGTGEQKTFSQNDLLAMMEGATSALETIHKMQVKILKEIDFPL